jgi:hypothetical protein
MNVTMENPGALPVTTAPLMLAPVAVGRPPFDCWLTNAVTALNVPPDTEIDTSCAAVAVLIT